jgi:GH25 family lysozyme M1 (1,4-beta-N-acetylmuramidase)
VKQDLTTFMNRVESATGQRVIVYVLDDFDAAYPVRGWFNQPWWTQRFLRRPGENDWAIWQVDSVAEIAGISGKVDLDVMRNPLS